MYSHIAYLLALSVLRANAITILSLHGLLLLPLVTREIARIRVGRIRRLGVVAPIARGPLLGGLATDGAAALVERLPFFNEEAGGYILYY